MYDGLIQMNAHMVVTDTARDMIFIGVILAVIFAVMAVAIFIEHGWKASAIPLVLAIAAAIVCAAGFKQPRVKEIKACANGQVSLEQVATRYEILNIDGKELTLREK